MLNATHLFYLKDTHRQTRALTEIMNMNIWVVDTSNQLFN